MEQYKDLIFSASFLFVVIRVCVPLMFASMSAYTANLSGLPNIAVEGIMLVAAIMGVLGSVWTSSAWLGLLIAIASGVAMALILVFSSIKLKTTPIMGGIALNVFASSFTVFLLFIITGSKGTTASLPSKVLPTINIPIIKDIPILGEIISGHNVLAYICMITAVLVYILVYKTKFGLHMRASGLDENAARSVGINVDRVRFLSLILSGVLAAIGGAYLSMGYLSFFTANMTASRGWIGIAAEAMGRGNFITVLLTTLVFGIFDAITNVLSLTNLPSELLQTIPYLAVFFAIIAYSIKEYNKKKRNDA